MKTPASKLALLLFSTLCWSAASPTVESFTSVDLLLGDSDGTPVVYFKPSADLTLVLSHVTHDGFGHPESYTLELELAPAPKLTVLVRPTPETKTSSVKFIAKAGERTLGELSAAKTTEALVALNPADAGGVVLAAPGELTLNITSEFAYDDFGRRQIAVETFVHAGAKWKVTFSDYTRDSFGRITGCRATISQVTP